MVEEGDDPLETLLVNGEEIDRERLARALAGLVGIDKEGARVVRRGEFESLTQREKTLAYLLARRAGALLGVMDEAAPPQRIGEDCGISPAAARARLSELKSENVVSRNDEKEYLVRTWQIPNAIQHLEGG